MRKLADISSFENLQNQANQHSVSDMTVFNGAVCNNILRVAGEALWNRIYEVESAGKNLGPNGAQVELGHMGSPNDFWGMFYAWVLQCNTRQDIENAIANNELRNDISEALDVLLRGIPDECGFKPDIRDYEYLTKLVDVTTKHATDVVQGKEQDRNNDLGSLKVSMWV